MVLSLLTPTGPNFMKDFPGQHAVNADRIDDYAGPCLTSDPLQTYTPQLTAATTNPVLGTGGFIRGYYYEIFDQIITWGEFRFGTAGISNGASTWMVSLPFPAKTVVGVSTILGNAPVVGEGVIWDDSAAAGRFPLTAHLRTTTQLMFGFRMGSGLGFREVSSSGPVSPWAIQDGLTWSARYQRLP
jgi:hypothetical protein